MFLRNQSLAGLLPTRGNELCLFLAVFVAVCCLSLLPTIRLLQEGFLPDSVFSLDLLQQMATSRSTWRALAHTLETGIAATVLAAFLGCSIAMLVGITDIRHKNALTFCFMLPMMIPPQITALSWIQLFGPSSVLLNMLGIAPAPGSSHPMYSPEGIILLLGIQQAPLVFLALKAGLAAMPREMVESARTCGAGRLVVLGTIVGPLMVPPLTAGLALAFVACIGNFGIPAMLGIPAQYTVLTTLIYQRLASFGPETISEAAALSMFISLLALLGVLFQSWAASRRDFRLVGGASAALKYHLGRYRLPLEFVCWAVITLILFVPGLALFCSSLVSAYGVRLGFETMTFSNYAAVLLDHRATARAFANSFLLSGGAAVILAFICVPLGYFLIWRKNRLIRWINPLAELPYALPGVVLSIGCILLYIRPLPLLGVSIYGTLWIILAAYLARFLPMILRPVAGGYAQVDSVLEEAGRMCGAGFFRRMSTIVLPLIGPAAMTGILFVFLGAFNELTVSVLLWVSGSETVGVVIFNMEEGGSSSMASAVSVLVILFVLGLMILLTFMGRKAPQGVIPWK